MTGRLQDPRIEARIGQMLKDNNLTFAAAESCTGGLVLHRMTNIAGSSSYVMGGVVAYDNRIKQYILGVDEETLRAYGAVSEQTALQMADGVRRLMGVHVAVSVTGIAGPGGGTEGKPIGLTYIGLSAHDGTEQVIRRVWESDREGNKALSADAALHLLYDYLVTLT
jgi:nicotinamide-nucleotide amidase